MDQQGWGQPPQGDPQQQQWGQPQGGTQPGTPDPATAGWFAQAAAQWPAPNDEEKQNAFYTHLFAAGLNVLCCGFAFPILGAFAPMMMTKSRHPFLLFHINQSVMFQVVVFAIQMVLVVLGLLLSLLCIGWLMYPINAIMWLLALIYPIIVGLKAKEGQWEKYAVIGDKVLAMKSPLIK